VAGCAAVERTIPLGVLMVVSAILLPTFALVCIALVDASSAEAIRPSRPRRRARR